MLNVLKIKWSNLEMWSGLNCGCVGFFIYLVIISERRLLTLKYFLIFLDNYSVIGNSLFSSSRGVFENCNVLITCDIYPPLSTYKS